MSGKKWSFFGLIVIVIVANLFLIFKKDSKIERAAYVERWTDIKEQDLVLSKNKPGVVVPAEEEYVYYQAGSGIFEEFLVSEGEEVQSGDPLFEYSPLDIEETISGFEAEITKLESELEALEENIEELEELEQDTDDPYGAAMASIISAEIYQQELELSRVEAEIEKYEEFIEIADDGTSHLTVDSGISGVVKNISRDLQNPVMTITSHDLAVEGVLDEDESAVIKEGMKAAVTSNKLKDRVEGTVSSVSVNPIEDPKLGEESEYSFTVELEDQPEEVIPAGSHVDMKITLDEASDVLTVSDKAIKGDSIFVLGSNGRINKRKIETGLAVNHSVEITSEAEEGELVVYKPNSLKNKTAFFTPINVSKLSKTELTKMPKKDILRYIGRGFLTK